MASKRDPQFPDITDISPLQYFHLLEQGHRPTRSQLAKLRSDNPTHDKPPKPEISLKRKSPSSRPEPKKKPKREVDLPSSCDKEEEAVVNYLASISWGSTAIGRDAFIRSAGKLLPVLIQSVLESNKAEYMPAQYCVQHPGSKEETWVDLRSEELLLGGEVVELKTAPYGVYQTLVRPGGPLHPDSIPVISLSDGTETIVSSQSLKLCLGSHLPSASEAIDRYQNWLSANSHIAVTAETIPKFVLKFVSIKTKKETKTGLLLRFNSDTGKVLLYIGTKLKWERMENCEIVGNLSDPAVPVQLLASFAYEADVVKAYKAWYQKEGMEVERAEREEGAFRKEVRCTMCKYILDELEYRECGKCGECRHVQCIEDNLSVIPLRGSWRCPNCPRCENCFSEIGKLFRCKACNSCFHEKCVDLLLAPTPSKNWKCENCTVCQFCGIRAVHHSVKWNDAATMCHPCESKWKKREYCPVCTRFWYFEGDRMSERVDPMLVIESQNMIQCDKCHMWIHMKCDLTVTTEEWAQYAVVGNGKKYYCPPCRTNKKNDEMVKLVKDLTSLDPQEFFHHYVDDLHYNKVIKRQMCFDQMMDFAKSGQYSQSPSLLKDHFKLICDNAMCYYKTNANGYVTAQKLLKDGLETIQKRLSLSTPKKKPAEKRPPKPTKPPLSLENHLSSFHIQLPTSLTKPELYDFDVDRTVKLPQITFQPPNDYFRVVISKKDIQPYLKYHEKPGFYLMGMAIAYMDEKLNWVELCCLCSSFVRGGEGWVCVVCGRAFHGFCLEGEKGKERKAWKCRECRVCEICNGTSDFSKLIYCSDCGKAYDTSCLWPHLTNLPPISTVIGWKCDFCFLCTRCGSASFLNGHSPSELGEIAADQDFSKCYQCFWALKNKEYCPVCEEDWGSVYSSGRETKERLVCKHCGFGFHRKCLDGPWKGGCASCLAKHMDFAEAEQTTIQQVQTLMELVSQINLYKSLCKDGVEKHYNLPPDFAKMLSNLFLVENSEFMSSDEEIKKLFQYRGVEIVKKQCKKEAGYRTTTLPLFHGLRRSDVPTAATPTIRLHSPTSLLPLYSLSWDTSPLVCSLPKFWTPLDSFSIVHNPPPTLPRDPGLFSPIREVVWDFGQYPSIADSCDFDQILHGTCYWWALETELSPPPHSEPADDLVTLSPSKAAEAHVEVLTGELDPLMLATQYVNQEVPTAIAFTAKFEKWLRSSLVKLTLHILNRNRSEKLPTPPAAYHPKLPELTTFDLASYPLLPSQPYLEAISDLPILGDETTSLVCVFCKQPGERSISGRLLPSEESLWAHVNCAYWSADIEFLPDCGGLLNFSQALTRGKKSKCSYCGLPGATVICSYKKCHCHYHFPCALAAEVRFFELKTVVCKHCPEPKDAQEGMDGERLYALTQKKWLFTTGKRFARKPPFVRGQFNRAGSLILREIPEKGVHEQLVSYRLTWFQGQRTLVCCTKTDSCFKVVEAGSGQVVASSERIEDLWLRLKLGESFCLRSAADFFGYSSLGNYLPPYPETASYFRSMKEKKPKSLQEILSELKSPQPGASVLVAFDKHKLRVGDRVKSRNTKSTHFEETEVGHRKDDLTLASEYRKYKKSPNRDDHLEVLSSTIHGLGLFTTIEYHLCRLLPGNLVVEYIGEVVRNRVADKREKEYEAKGIGQGSCYMFRLDEDFIVDATVKGGKARFINHSCQPSCEATICEINSEKHILLFAKRRIFKGEEITYDYHFEVETDKISCTCGSKDCQGKLN